MDDAPPTDDLDPLVLATDLAAVRSTGVTVEGGVIQVAETTWALYGQTTYDGEVLVAEYHDEAEARAVLRATGDPLT